MVQDESGEPQPEQEGPHLERLGIPVLHFLDRRHVAEVVRELVELLDTMC